MKKWYFICSLFLKLHCDSRLQRAFTACKEITLVGSNQGNYVENAIACSKRTLKTIVATQLKWTKVLYDNFISIESMPDINSYFASPYHEKRGSNNGKRDEKCKARGAMSINFVNKSLNDVQRTLICIFSFLCCPRLPFGLFK